MSQLIHANYRIRFQHSILKCSENYWGGPSKWVETAEHIPGVFWATHGHSFCFCFLFSWRMKGKIVEFKRNFGQKMAETWIFLFCGPKEAEEIWSLKNWVRNGLAEKGKGWQKPGQANFCPLGFLGFGQVIQSDSAVTIQSLLTWLRILVFKTRQFYSSWVWMVSRPSQPEVCHVPYCM